MTKYIKGYTDLEGRACSSTSVGSFSATLVKLSYVINPLFNLHINNVKYKEKVEDSVQVCAYRWYKQIHILYTDPITIHF